VELRAAEPDEIPALARLLLRASPGRSVDHEIAYVQAYFEHSETVITVAVDDGALVGVVSFEPYRIRGDAIADDQLAYLRLIAVDPSLWGSGLAARLLRWASARMLEAGFTAAYLSCGEQNGRARRFYEREGWRVGPRTRTHADWGAMVEYTIVLDA
jgi:ribosomal protein S18 acetylase RimI-like enzyme